LKDGGSKWKKEEKMMAASYTFQLLSFWSLWFLKFQFWFKTLFFLLSSP
jgi:hypothetical protein